MACECGQQIESSGGLSYSFAQYYMGEIVYAVCQHGCVVVDKRSKNDFTLNGDKINDK